MKRLMLLGGLRYLLPVIEEAHKFGIYVMLSSGFEVMNTNPLFSHSYRFGNFSPIIWLTRILKIQQ